MNRRPVWAEGRWVDSRKSPRHPYRRWVEIGPLARSILVVGLAVVVVPWWLADAFVATASTVLGLLIVWLGFSCSASTDGPHRWADERQRRVYPDDVDRMPGQYEEALAEALAERGVHDVDPAAFAVLSAATRAAWASVLRLIPGGAS